MREDLKSQTIHYKMSWIMQHLICDYMQLIVIHNYVLSFL
jgi:hypothetical protein